MIFQGRHVVNMLNMFVQANYSILLITLFYSEWPDFLQYTSAPAIPHLEGNLSSFCL